MTTLVNFPLKNQRITVTSNGTIDINADYDCVPTSIAAAMQYLTGLKFEGGVLKEVAYGVSYQGGTAASAYVQYAAQHGVRLYSMQGSNTDLIAAVHLQIQAGHPVLITIPDPYLDLTVFPGASHVEVFFGESTGNLTVLDPFIARAVTKTDQEWAALLQFGEVWILERIEDKVSISLTTPGISTFFSQALGNAWKCNKNGFLVGNAILSFYRMFGGSALCGVTYLGLPTSDERGIADKPGVVTQAFERATVCYDPGHLLDNPPGSGVVYLIHAPTQTVTANDPATLAQLSTTQALASSLQAKIDSIKEIVK